MGLEKIHILLAALILWLLFTCFAVWHSKKKKKEFDLQMAESDRNIEILKKISQKLNAIDEKEQLDSSTVDELEELHKQLKGRK